MKQNPESLETLDTEIQKLLTLRAAMVCRQAGVAENPLPEESLEAIFRDIHSVCRQLVAPTKVAFLGPLYSYSHLALMRYFGSGPTLAPVTTIDAVFEEVSRKQADFGVVPVENSTDGRVVDALESFMRTPANICGEVEIPIHHALLAVCPREEIAEVHSKPQVLSQCRHWIAKHLPGVRVVEAPSSADAARTAQQKPGVAAISNEYAAKVYGLNILADAIEDNPHNRTRFVILGGQSTKKTGRDKTTLMLELPHHPGSLADVMTIFKKKHLNLTWIESFPIPESSRTYLFFIDFEGHQTELRVRQTLEMLRKKTVRVEVLGSYAQAEVEK